MELRHLRSFVTLADTLHFGRAAAALNISQPPLSQQIQLLERELGLQLFERNRRGVTLTAAGHHLLPGAQRIVANCAEFSEYAEQIHRGRTGALRIAHIASAMLDTLPRLINPFIQAHPEAQLSLTQLDSGGQIDALRRREIDVAFLRMIKPPEDLEALTVTREPLVAVVHSSTEAARVKEFTLSELADRPFIGPSRAVAPAYWHAVDALCTKYGFTPRVAHESGDVLNIGGFVDANMGVSLVPASSLRIPFAEVIYHDIPDDEALLSLHMAWVRQEGFPLLADFIVLARNFAKKTGTPLRQATSSRSH